MIEVLPGWHVQPDRAYEWFFGIRPLPGTDDDAVDAYYDVQIESGALSPDSAAKFKRRHLALEVAEEQAAEPLPPNLVAELLRRGWTPPPNR